LAIGWLYGTRTDETCQDQGIRLKHGYDVVPHGLRKNGVIALLEAGCSVPEVAAISRQSLQVVEYYGKRRDQNKLGDAAILRWEHKIS